MVLVMDSSAIVALLKAEDGGLMVAEALGSPDNTCHMHAVNMCEVYYGVLRGQTEAFARGKVLQLQEAGISLRTDMDPEFWQSAGKIKADLARISLADCMCVALAIRLGGQAVTADHHEFDAVANSGLCRVQFIR